jgi:hypothetical protein
VSPILLARLREANRFLHGSAVERGHRVYGFYRSPLAIRPHRFLCNCSYDSMVAVGELVI